jgi:Fe-S-cluster-containing dehydrogenase component
LTHCKDDGIPDRITPAEDGHSVFNPLCSRREVLIWGGVSIAGLTALSPALVMGADRPLIIMEKAEGLVIADPVVCVGCGRCELACTEFNFGKASPSLSRIKVDRNLNFGAEGAMAWREGHGNLGDGLIVQNLCLQCPHPVPCATICPENAIVVSAASKARTIDPTKCTGCGICLRACPWEMISYDPDTRKATKCDLCRGKPKCVAACPAGSLRYVTWRDLTGKTPQRNLNTAPLPPQRSNACAECHMPGQAAGLKQAVAMMLRTFRGDRSGSSDGLGFSWIDIAGAILVPLTFASVLVHAVVRKVRKR